MGQSESTREFNRRDFLRIAGLVGTAAGITYAWALANQFISFGDSNSTLLRRAFRDSATDKLSSVVANAHAAPYRTEAEQTIIVENAVKLGASVIRVFIPDEYEPVVGEYDTAFPDMVNHFAELASDQTAGKMKVLVSLFDNYRRIHSRKWNPVYGSLPLLGDAYTDPEINSLPKSKQVEAQNSFYTDPQKMTYYQRRVNSLLPHLTAPNLRLELINEPEYQSPNPTESRLVLTNWITAAAAYLRGRGYSKTIVTGTYYLSQLDPDELKKLNPVMVSAHYYPTLMPTYLATDQKHIPAQVAWGITEIGIPNWHIPAFSSFDGVNYAFISSTIQKMASASRNKPMTLGHWHVDPTHQDNFYFDPQANSRTTDLYLAFSRLFA